MSDDVQMLRVGTVVAAVVGAHLTVLALRRVGRRVSGTAWGRRYSKARTLSSLAISVTVFTLYFVALGMVLREFGVSLTAYFASASVVGLAVAFGSQGLVQDVVTSLTVLASNLFDVGDMVEIAGQTGRVRSLGIRFTVLTNFVGAEVFIPNRTLANVIRYPRG